MNALNTITNFMWYVGPRRDTSASGIPGSCLPVAQLAFDQRAVVGEISGQPNRDASRHDVSLVSIPQTPFDDPSVGGAGIAGI